MQSKAKSFGKYSDYYDLLYKDKNYRGEVAFIEKIFKEYSKSPVRTLLEGGCGTGGHATLLAKKYRVTGIDLSENMLQRARAKAKVAGLDIDFRHANLINFKLKRKFDASLCMFAMLGYINETADLLTALRNIRVHLAPDALFTCDFWNGLAVMRLLPAERIKIIEDGHDKIIRVAHPELDALNHICRVNYRLIVISHGKVIDEIIEMHSMRFFFPMEITHLVQEAGFEVITMCPFMDLKGKVDESIWNVALVARAI